MSSHIILGDDIIVPKIYKIGSEKIRFEWVLLPSQTTLLRKMNKYDRILAEVELFISDPENVKILGLYHNGFIEYKNYNLFEMTKGLVFSSLCFLLNYLLINDHIEPNCKLWLDAYASHIDDDSALKLITFYKSIGFRSSMSTQEIKRRYKDKETVPMNADLSKVLNACKQKAKHNLNIHFIKL